MNVKNGLRKTLACVLAVVMLLTATPMAKINFSDFWLTASAQSETEGIFTYEVNYDSATITKCDNTVTGEVVIPSTLGGKQVTRIGENAFEWCDKMTSVVIPEGVTRINSSAFSNCIDLESVTIPSSMSYIQDTSFENCGKLNKVFISDLVSWCKGYGYYRYSSFKNAFDLYLNDELLTDVVVPSGVTEIGNGAFYNCKSITTIEFPETVGTIGRFAFSDCKNLKDFVFPENITSIGECAFSGCSSLQSITIPGSIAQIQDGTFNSCSNLESVVIEEGVKGIGNDAFRYCENLKSVTIPSSLRSISSSAFDDCTSSKNVYITDLTAWCNISFDSGDSNPLYYSNGNLYLNNELVTDLVIPNGIKTINDYAFCGSSIKSVVIPDSVRTIGRYAFDNCKYLENVAIPDSVTSIGYYAFNRTGLKSVTIPKSVTSIGDHAFGYMNEEWDKIYDFVIRGYVGTAAETYANNNSFTFIDLDTHVHSYSEKITKQPTCTEEGEKSLICICGEAEKVEKIPATGHKEVQISPKAPTCLEDGQTGGKRCSVCGEILVEPTVIKAVGHHTEEILSAVAPTCTKSGLTEGKKCSVCGEILVAQETVNPTGHTDEDGDRICDVCGSETEPIIEVDVVKNIKVSGANFTYVVFMPKASGVYTFKSKANVDTYGCVCDANKNVLANDDDSGDGNNFSITIELIGGNVYYLGARYYSSGNNGSFNVVITCDRVYCKHENTETKPAIAKTCTTDGYTEGVFCNDCETWVSGHEVIDAGHEDENSDSVCDVCGRKMPIYVGDCYGKYYYNNYFSGEYEFYPDGEIIIRKTAKSKCDTIKYIENIGEFKEQIKRVTIIGDFNEIIGAFDGCAGLKSVSLPDTLTTIGACSFRGCKGLRKIDLPDSVNVIVYEAFRGCVGLKSINIPKNVEYIGRGAFRGCTGLTNIQWNNKLKRIDNGTFSGCIGIKEIDIPDTVNYIGTTAFYNCSLLSEVDIPSSVEIINNNAFANCKNLSKVILNDGTETIGSGAFENCESLKELSVPDSVTEIGSGAFSNCISLERVDLSSEIICLNSYIFGNCEKLKAVAIPEKTEYIGSGAFYNCSSIESINVPSKVKTIDSGAFSGCLNLKKVETKNISSWCMIDFGDATSNPLYYAGELYQNGEKVTSLEIPDTISTVKPFAFYNCRSIESVSIPESVTSIGKHAFRGCTGITEVVIPESVTNINASAFRSCRGLSAVTIPDSVTLIGYAAFYNCKNLKRVTVPYSVTKIGEKAFYGKSYLTICGYADSAAETFAKENGFKFELVCKHDSAFYKTVAEISATCTEEGFTEGVFCEKCNDWVSGHEIIKAHHINENGDRICDVCGSDLAIRFGSCGENAEYRLYSDGELVIEGSGALSNCAGEFKKIRNRVKKITVSDGVTTLGASSFANFKNLFEVVLPESVTDLGTWTFAYCKKLSSINIPNGVKSIGDSVFSNCKSLKSVKLPDGVIAIGECAFAASGLETIDFGKSLKTISYSAFSGCKNLSEIMLPDTVTDIGSSAFNYCTGLKKAALSLSLSRIGNGAFSYCSSLEFVEIKSAKTIAEKAFFNCGSLKSVSVPDNNKSVGEKAFGYLDNMKNDEFSVSGHADSASETYANDNGFRFIKRNHDFKRELTTAPTCFVNGLATYSCSCGKTYTETIPSKQHDFKKEVAIVANCVSDGLYVCTCKNCGFSKVEIMPANGHKFVVDAAGKEPTCTEPGVSKAIHCTECGYTEKSEVIPALGHNIVIDIEAKEPTCTEAGTTEGLHCTRCDYKAEAEKIEPLGHTDSDNDGKCDRCGESLVRPNPSSNCSCACHKKGIAKFFFKIGLFFQKIFKKNKVCKCGVWHY